MKVAILNLDWIPVIPGGKLVGETERHDMRDTTCFRADDGWTITRLPNGDFEVDREGLPAPVVIGDGYAFTRAPIEVVDTEEVAAGDWKRQHAKKVKR